MGRDLQALDQGARNAGGGFSVMGGAIASALGGAALGAIQTAAGALAGFVGESINAAGTFEAGMNSFAAAAGNMGQEEIGQFKDLFLSLGKELPVSTQEVQQAAIALVKGGLDPAVISAGALEDSLKFAAAAGMGLEEAAELGVKMLGTFVPVTASAAEQTAFLAESQELLVKAANASTLNVDALGDAMLQAGGQARAVGLDYQDFVTTMGLISPAFGSAAEAGTSFKNFLVRLQPSTAPAREAMSEIGLLSFNTADAMKYLAEQGIQPAGEDANTLASQLYQLAIAQGKSTEKALEFAKSFETSVFYDAAGQFVGVEQAAQLLQDSLSGLTDAQRVQALQTIFGNDAMGAASALAEGGAEAYQLFAQKMAEANGIQAQTAATQQGFNFAMENAKGSIEALQITIGTMLLPVLTELIQNVITPGINTLTTLAEAFGGNTEAMASLSPAVQALIPIVQQIAGAIAANWQPALAAIGAVIGAAVMPALAGFVVAVAPVVAAVAGAIAIGAALYGAWNSNFMGIQQITASALAAVQGVVTSVMGVVLQFWTDNGSQIMAFAQTAWGQIQEIIGGIVTIIATIISNVFGGIQQFISENGAEIQVVLSTVWNSIQNIISLALNTVQGIVTTVLGVVTGDWEKAGQGIGQIVDGIKTYVVDQFNNLLRLIDGLSGGFGTAALNLAGSIVDGLVDGISAGATAVIDSLVGLATDALNAAKEALGISSPSRVFAEGVGVPIAQGMAAGMLQAAPLVSGAAGALASGAYGGARSTVINRNISVNQTINNGPAGFRQDAAIVRTLAGGI